MTQEDHNPCAQKYFFLLPLDQFTLRLGFPDHNLHQMAGYYAQFYRQA